MSKQHAATLGFIVALMAVASSAHAGISQWTDGFEGSASGWWVAGNAGIDRGIGLAHSGANNGWVRNWTGWNAVNTSVSTYPGAVCTVGAWLRSSESMTGGYMTIRSWSSGNPILHEIPLAGPGPANPPNANYNFYTFSFVADAYSAMFYVGLWGNGQDAWIQVDDVVVSCPTPF
jgi:hypothetical protein